MTPVRDLATLVRRAASVRPDEICLIFDETGERLTFADVDVRSDAIAGALRAAGIAPSDRVAVMLRNRPEFPLTWLACAKLGAAMVPVNVYSQISDAKHLLDDSGARIAVAAGAEADLLRSLGATVLDADALPVRGDAPQVPVASHTTVNIQYTSGTTGPPKGCVLGHGYWLEIARQCTGDPVHLSAGDVMLTAQPFYYMDPQWNVAAALATGARLVVLDRFHPSTFISKVSAYGVHFFYCLGVMPVLLLKTPPSPDDRAHPLRAVLCSGIPRELHARIEERFGVRWFEAYGLTEAGGGLLTVNSETHDELVGSGAIGWPMDRVDVRLVGPDGRPVAPGETGEIVVRTGGMMDGYWDGERASPDAFADGWLHTGDLARTDERGCHFFAGRSKDVIKRAGETISCSEVEMALELHPSVKLAAVVAVPDEIRGEEVAAFVVGSDDFGDLAAHCERHLAYFKVPRYWRAMDDLPRTPSEKIAKWQLRAAPGDLYDRKAP